jgi:propanediol dehydratase small subunit
MDPVDEAAASETRPTEPDDSERSEVTKAAGRAIALGSLLGVPILASGLVARQAPNASAPLAITHVTVVDTANGSTLDDMTIVVALESQVVTQLVWAQLPSGDIAASLMRRSLLISAERAQTTTLAA